MKVSSQSRYVFLLLVMVTLNYSLLAETSLKANPDCFSTGFSLTTRGIPSIKVGDLIMVRRVLIGGMVEARNEARFNQALLPNHNWRGLCRVETDLFARSLDRTRLALRVNLSHESAHATMGIRESTQKALELIYDDVYRQMILNALSLSGSVYYTSAQAGFLTRVDGHFFFLSKNTPEFTGSRLGFGSGFSFGLEYFYHLIHHTHCYVSLHDRFVLQCRATDEGYLHTGNNDSLKNELTSYPIINKINTLVVKGGISIGLGTTSKALDFYVRVLYGGIYGFVDSRDIRLMTSLGFEFSL